MTSTPADDGLVVDAVRAGDEAMLSDLYARWSPLVYSLALRSLGDVAAAEQVTQHVFDRAWLSQEAFDRSRAPVDWLIALACDAVVEAGGTVSHAGSAPEKTKLDYSPHVGSKTGALAERLLVADGMSHLGARPRQLLRMALDQHLTVAEIAGRTGLRVEEVRSEVVRSLTELRLRLKEEQADAH
ncbi:MAG: RNA polymerase sigma factor [Janthinobacterium lividum]